MFGRSRTLLHSIRHLSLPPGLSREDPKGVESSAIKSANVLNLTYFIHSM